MEPCERHWKREIKANPWSWLGQQLSDVGAVAVAVGVDLRDPAAEAERVRPDAGEIVAAARRLAASECRSKEQCHAWASDAEHAVRLMLDSLQRPALLDRDHLSLGWRPISL